MIIKDHWKVEEASEVDPVPHTRQAVVQSLATRIVRVTTAQYTSKRQITDSQIQTGEPTRGFIIKELVKHALPVITSAKPHHKEPKKTTVPVQYLYLSVHLYAVS